MNPKESRWALGLFNLKTWNMIVIVKSLWALAHSKEQMWIKWVYIYYLSKEDFWEVRCPSQTA